MSEVIVMMEVGPYRVGQRLGIGGMSEVYVAMPPGADPSPVALKLLLPHLAEDQAAVKMFINEARLVAHMNHPNIVRVLDVGKDGDRFYQAMELVKGVPLSTLIRALLERDERPPPELVVYVARALCAGLHYAHDHRSETGEALDIVHRDISPQNLLVSIDGDVKVADWGIARARNSISFTSPGNVRGKCEYVAPEQARALEVDRRSDVFSAAVTVAHFATGVSPFRRQYPMETMEAVVYEPMPDLQQLRRELPGALCRAIAKAVEKAPEQRFASAQAMLDALPEASSGARAALGALVTRLCRDDVERIDEKTAATRMLDTQTRTGAAAAVTFVPSSARTLDGELRVARPRVSRAPWVFGSLAFVALAVALVGVAPALRSPEPSTHAPALAAAVVPSPAPSAVSLPAPRPVAAPPREPEAEAVAEAAVGDPVPVSEAGHVSVPPPARKRASPAPPPPPRRAGLGYLTIDATPWAHVYVRGRHVGETPLATVPVESGEVSVVLKSPDTGREVTRIVFIAAGREVFLKEDMK